MTVSIRTMRDDDIEAVVQLSLAAWEPVFNSFEQVLGSKIYTLLYPNWRKIQSEVVETMCNDREHITTWVAEVDHAVVGFIAYQLHSKDKTGEVELLAVAPEYQNRGIGTELNTFVLQQMKASGIELAVVGTGGDPGHAPARKSYEKAGYTALPLVRYYKNI